MKDMDEQIDEEIHRVMSGRIPSAEFSIPMKLGQVTLLIHGCVCQPKNSQNPILLEFLRRLYHMGMIDHYLHFQLFFLLWKRWPWRVLKIPSF